MGDPYGAYGGGGPAYNQVSQPTHSDYIYYISARLQCFIFALLTISFLQPMIYGRGPAPAGMRMVPMVLPDGRLGYVL
jgi:heterogeneous nuclear ribonucleoprotein R